MIRALTPVLLSITFALAACGERGGSGVEAAVEMPPVAVYSVRGEVEDLPPEGQQATWIALRHEAIPDFVGVTGDPEPMHSMTMRFPVDESVDLGGLSAGDKLRFDLAIDWNAGDPARVLAFEPLPVDTELDFGGGDEHAGH